ncbi:hypothetical protein [Clostridium uliginosum]|uniref:Uncharacterized protein n=1 Tax=Clostridium uliginosum TaxID=119641 RepID=A0A1I1LUS8_9CLOT|nr:hypothetical protein [Clostridium uliginosum]SFC76735.1 hypothetical protein SAMN05421842_10940 [Clostridium uliginosum]
MANPFDILIYLDEYLVKNLSSLVLSGYIDTRILRNTRDKTCSSGLHLEKRNGAFTQETCGKNEREGFKDRNKASLMNQEKHDHICGDLDERNYAKQEEEIRRTYTTFVLNQNLNNYLNSDHILQYKNEKNIFDNAIASGELIEVTGKITNQCLTSYLDILINLLTSIGCENLNTILNKEKSNFINFSVFLNMISHLKETLILNNTQDLMMSMGKCTAILTVNTKNFMNSECNMFDKINCDCKVIGKVIKTCANGECINFLRKTGQDKFYEEFLSSCNFLLDSLKENGIIIPEMPCCKIEENAIQILPLSISI